MGGSNTLVTLVLFIVLQRWLTAGVAYTVVFVLGVVYTTTMTAGVVFGSRLRIRTAALFVAWYLVVYGVGLGVIALLHLVVHPSATVTALVTVAVTAPLSFIGGRALFHDRSRDPRAG